jgi:uncharacterized protein YecE (DUF72 family)
VNEILVGTASWADKTLIQSGRFYPPTAKTPEARLRYYAERFPLVEIDTSYYGLPSAETAEHWAERTPPEFVFDVKAFRSFTGHPARPSALPADLRQALGAPPQKNIYYRDLPEELRAELWSRFRAALSPLKRAHKLGAVLLQFAPWVIANRDGHALVAHAAQMLEGYPLAVEFRNKSWFSDAARERVLAFEREHGLAHVVVDEPQGFPSSVPQIWEATNEQLGVLRLHGHNHAMWTAKHLASSAERFNYYYSPSELDVLAESATRLKDRVRRLHVLFNNCFEDKAQRNALEFTQRLAGVTREPLPAP